MTSDGDAAKAVGKLFTQRANSTNSTEVAAATG